MTHEEFPVDTPQDRPQATCSRLTGKHLGPCAENGRPLESQPVAPCLRSPQQPRELRQRSEIARPGQIEVLFGRVVHVSVGRLHGPGLVARFELGAALREAVVIQELAVDVVLVLAAGVAQVVRSCGQVVSTVLVPHAADCPRALVRIGCLSGRRSTLTARARTWGCSTSATTCRGSANTSVDGRTPWNPRHRPERYLSNWASTEALHNLRSLKPVDSPTTAIRSPVDPL